MPLEEVYQERVASGELQQDSAQARAVSALAALERQLLRYTGRRKSFFAALLNRPGSTPKGLYIYGGVGRGKSLLMDCFAAVISPRKRCTTARL